MILKQYYKFGINQKNISESCHRNQKCLELLHISIIFFSDIFLLQQLKFD